MVRHLFTVLLYVALLAACSEKGLQGKSKVDSSTSVNSQIVAVDGMLSSNPGQSKELLWSGGGEFEQAVEIEMSFDNGLTWQVVSTYSPADESINITTPYLPGSEFILRIRTEEGVVATSEPIKILGQIPSLSVDGNVNPVAPGSNVDLIWQPHDDQILPLSLQASINGSPFEEILKVNDNSGSLTITTPPNAGNLVRYRLKSDPLGATIAQSELLTISDSISLTGVPSSSINSSSSVSQSARFKMVASVGGAQDNHVSQSFRFEMHSEIKQVTE